jgi:hypothetical protein
MLMNLPDSCSIVRALARVVNNRDVNQTKPQELWPIIDASTNQNQRFNQKIEVRGITSDPTSLLELTFWTFD